MICIWTHEFSEITSRIFNKQVNICETFPAVSLSFIKVSRFNDITTNLMPMQVVDVLNTVFSTFDRIVEQHGVYKVSKNFQKSS